MDLAGDEKTFRLEDEDFCWIELLIDIIRTAFHQRSFTGRQITALGRFIESLERMPALDPDIATALTVQKGPDDEDHAYFCVELSDSRFRLSSLEVQYDPNVGSDTATSFPFIVTEHGRGSADPFGIEEWINIFGMCLEDQPQKFTIEEDGEIV